MTVLRTDLGFNDWITLFEDRGPMGNPCENGNENEFHKRQTFF